MDTFDWLATDSAPQNFPMQIVRGDLILANGGSLYIPDTRTLMKGWGRMESSHVVGPELKPLPTAIDITFFSYTEDVFYQGSFDLPRERIRQLFQDGYYSPKLREDTTYRRVMTGIAPGGVVAVWLLGPDRITEVFYDKAPRADLPWSTLTDNQELSREEFVRLELEDSLAPEQRESLQRDGVPLGRWDRYRQRYGWQPVIVSSRQPALINRVGFFNGELDYYRYPLSEEVAAALRPVPRDLAFIWRNSSGKSYWVEYDFDADEIFAAFDQLAPDEASANPIQLELIVTETDGGRTISSQLRHADRVIKLERTRLASPPTGLSDEEIDSM